MVLWIDNFLFNGEDVVKLRLKYLYNHVDKFYICEQRYTYQGELKPELFIEKCKDWFADYMDKIVFVIDNNSYVGSYMLDKYKDVFITDNTTKNKDAWIAENSARNFSKSYILNDYPTEKFICSVCDCDEIPDIYPISGGIENPKDYIYDKTLTYPLHMEQNAYYYNLQRYVGEWCCAFFISDVIMKKDVPVETYRTGKLTPRFSFKCGWHFSYFMSLNNIKRKIDSFAHTEFTKYPYNTMEYIKYCVGNGKDLFNNVKRDIPLSTSLNFPKEVLEFGEYINKLQS